MLPLLIISSLFVGNMASPLLCAMGCGAVYDPVCGSDGQTYSNLCMLGIESCHREVKGNEKIHMAYKGACGSNDLGLPSFSMCDMMCMAVYMPVCGTDGQTYGNACELGVASCQNQLHGHSAIHVSQRTACGGGTGTGINPLVRDIQDPINAGQAVSGGSLPGGIAGGYPGGVYGGPYYPYYPTGGCDQICNEEKQPICGSDGVVYENRCRFTLAQCAAQKEGVYLNAVSYSSTCSTPKEPNCSNYTTDTTGLAVEGPLGSTVYTCPHSSKLVCTTRGTTMRECSLCMSLQQEIEKAKLNSAIKIPDIKVLHDGACQGMGAYPYPGYYPGGGLHPIDPILAQAGK